MKYIFIAGAPGSKWSSVNKNIYWSPSIDHSDYSPKREYYHDAGGEMDLMHIASYFDPGMEFGDFFDDLESYTVPQCEAEFDRPFDPEDGRIKIIKSHVFCNHIPTLKERWPDCPIVLVWRDNDACLGWWVKCGHFNITYPEYGPYYENLKKMGVIIEQQNHGIAPYMNTSYPGLYPNNSNQLSDILGISKPLDKGWYQNYNQSNVVVKVI